VSPPRAKTFADRLPEVVEREETDIAYLSDEMAAEVYPGRRRQPFRLGVQFEKFPGDNYVRAVEIARRAPDYRERMVGTTPVHEASFGVDQAEELRALFRFIEPVPGVTILVNGRKAPGGRNIWPLLLGILAGGEAWEPLDSWEA
jgi:hypothetical protein